MRSRWRNHLKLLRSPQQSSSGWGHRPAHPLLGAATRNREDARLLDRALYGYACILERWSLLTLATKVRNHIKWNSISVLSDLEESPTSVPANSATILSSVSAFALEHEVLCSPEECFRCGEALGTEDSSATGKRAASSAGTSSRPLWWCRHCNDFVATALCVASFKNGPANL